MNWNRADDTIECLKSCFDLRIKNYELRITVVDNGSTDNSASNIERFVNRKSHIVILKNSKNLGFAEGNNVGIKYALKNGADYVVVLNNDTRVDPTMLIRIIKVARKYPDFGAASPKIFFEKGFEFHKERYKSEDLGKVIWYAGGEIDWDNVYGKTLGVDEVDKGQFGESQETAFATGTCMFLSRKALEKVGLFDERYFMYYEDTDLSMRIKRGGFKVLYVPDAIIWHKVAQSSDRKSVV